MSAAGRATFDQAAIDTITSVARVMYPHDALPDDVFARVADRLAEAASSDDATADAIATGISVLNGGGRFSDLSEEIQIKALTEIEGSTFFELARAHAVVEVYSDPRTWEVLGYEGPSFDKGGYVTRGFDDLDWLPDPEALP